MTDTTADITKDFSHRHPKFGTLEQSKDSVYLRMEQPSSLAAFFAFCNGKKPNTRIYLRGGTKNFPTTFPSLFREQAYGCGKEEKDKRWKAYKCVLQRIRTLDGGRWRRKDIGAVLQHYGIKTPWLDVVRNLYTAIWFASHDLMGIGMNGETKPTSGQYGWISVYRRRNSSSKKLFVKDLSNYHSSRHLRSHTQHGMSIAMQPDEDVQPHQCQDFNRYRIAQIRIPIEKKWSLYGHMYSSAFMFPPHDLDDSLKRLSASSVQDILNDACNEFKLDSGSLGRICCYG